MQQFIIENPWVVFLAFIATLVFLLFAMNMFLKTVEVLFRGRPPTPPAPPQVSYDYGDDEEDDDDEEE